MALAAALLNEVVDGSSATWIRSPLADSTLVTERSSFLADLDGVFLVAASPSGMALRDVLALSDPEGMQHGKLRLIPVRNHGSQDIPGGVTILDGARAISRLGQFSARSIVVLLDRADYDEEVVNDLNRFLAHSIDEGVHMNACAEGLIAPPPSIDVFAFALPDDRDAIGGTA
ncbi:hypothetical protein [Achromobacter aegrifaciens]|uniref:hypothetical protein n=1 Tax=Achromobacter aegrifaciens TaxID=1287736 RepID=UPI00320AB256